MRDYLDDLEQRNGTAYLETVAITLARVHFKSLDDLARAIGADTNTAGHRRNRNPGGPLGFATMTFPSAYGALIFFSLDIESSVKR